MLASIYPLLLQVRKLKSKKSHILPKVTEVVSENGFKTRFTTKDPKPTLSLMPASEGSSLLGSTASLVSSPSFYSHLLYSTPPLTSFLAQNCYSWPSPVTCSCITWHSCALPRPHVKVALPQASSVLACIFSNAVFSAQKILPLYLYQAKSSSLSEDQFRCYFLHNSFINSPK